MGGWVPVIVLSGNRSTALGGPIKSDAHTRSTSKGKKGRARLTVQIDYQIIFRTPDLPEQIDECQ